VADPAQSLVAELAAGTTTVADDEALRNLTGKIDHVVVLMLENRSFDHMLGFLALEQGRGDVEAALATDANEANDRSYPIHPAVATTLNKRQDPDHSSAGVDQQIAGGAMSGFAQNFADKRKRQDPAIVMAYHTAEQLPVYAYLAEKFCVCDHWHCSVPGETMPNRCYAVAGTSAGTRDNLRPARPYGLTSFCRHLDKFQVGWRWYSHDYVPMLWLIDPQYGLSDEAIPSYFDRKDVFGRRSFLERAAAGDLPALSWIDPNFIDLNLGPGGSNDDHPPSDLHAGQKLVLDLFDAVAQSPAWERTMIVVTYDEHGGFYDHLAPPAAEDDYPELRRLGPRVPALVVSPWVEERQVEHTLFDHTSIIKTILARFCRQPDGGVPDMGARVRAAEHLGRVLTREQPREQIARADYQSLIEQARAWEEGFAHQGVLATAETTPEPALTDFQKEYLGYQDALLKQRQAKGVTPAVAVPAGAAPSALPQLISIDPDYSNRRGYEPAFLGSGDARVELPTLPKELVPLAAISKEAHREPPYVFDYHHFSIVMNKERRLAFFTAVNIDGALGRRLKRERDHWIFDPRIAEDEQAGPEVYSENDLDLGHLVRRLDPAWGESIAIAKQGNDDTFHYTNCTPQHKDFNRNKTSWAGIEDYILEHAENLHFKVNVFTGPVLDAQDEPYREILLPRQFWKLVAMVKQDRTLSATAYLLSQEALIKHPGVVPTEFTYGAYRTYQVPVPRVEELTQLSFDPLAAVDPLGRLGAAAAEPAAIERFEQIVL
jgi:DNA/RNA endonuclease G (NUC1)/phospholipase C